MKVLCSLCILLWSLFAYVHAKSVAGDRLLVVSEETEDRNAYSQFFADLEARDFKLSFESPKDTHLSLFHLGETKYDHVLLLPPKSKGYGPNLTPKNLLDFASKGGNILLALSAGSSIPSAINALLLELEIALPSDRTSHVVDHFQYDTISAAEQHDVLVLPRPTALRPDVNNFFGGDGLIAVPRAIGQSLGHLSALTVPILRAPTTAYSYSSKGDAEVEALDEFATGSQIALISALQARNSARFTVVGSSEMLQNKWFNAEVQVPSVKGRSKTVNRQFATQLTEWAFKEVGVLKAGKVRHRQLLENSNSAANSTAIGFSDTEIYRVKVDVSYSIELSIWDKTRWKPYIAPAADKVQLEFTMLSPFHRLNLAPTAITSDAQTYSTTFRTPDQHGVFAFKVNYKRPFLTNVEERDQVTVRHFAHDEWPRSYVISGAWPWIGGLWSVILGFLAFCVLWLYCEPPKEAVREKLRDDTNTSQ